MSPVQTPEPVPVSAWVVEAHRLTLFPQSVGATYKDVFRQITREQPESTATQPKIGVQISQGAIPAGLLVITEAPDRLEVTLTASEREPSRSLGSFEDIHRVLRDLLAPWLEENFQKNPLRRIGLGTVLRLPIVSKEDGYRQLSAYLPFQLDSNSSDFLFQLNRRQKSSVLGDVEINRLTKWSVNYEQLVMFGPFGGVPVPQVFVQENRLACRLEIDVNTAPEKLISVSGGKVIEEFDELGEITKAIIAKGVRE